MTWCPNVEWILFHRIRQCRKYLHLASKNTSQVSNRIQILNRYLYWNIPEAVQDQNCWAVCANGMLSLRTWNISYSELVQLLNNSSVLLGAHRDGCCCLYTGLDICLKVTSENDENDSITSLTSFGGIAASYCCKSGLQDNDTTWRH